MPRQAWWRRWPLSGIRSNTPSRMGSGHRCRPTVELLESRTQPSAALDPTFGVGGLATADFPPDGLDGGGSVAVAPDGRILVAGGTGQFLPSGDFDQAFAVARFNTDGTLDTTFGTGGRVIVDFGNLVDGCTCMAVGADGSVVLAGYVDPGPQGDIALAKLTPTGQLDPTFGTGGRALVDHGGNEVASSIIILPDGRILLTAYQTVVTDGDFLVTRLTPTGQLDPTFGDGGFGTADFGGGMYDYAGAMAVQADGRIVLVGGALFAFDGGPVSAAGDAAVARFTADGHLDPTFGTGGKVVLDFGATDEGIGGVAVQPDGRLVLIGGRSTTVGSTDLIAVRLTPNGQLDPTFGTGGKQVFGFAADEGATGLVLQPDGGILVAGTSFEGASDYDIFLARLTPVGQLDPTFGPGGRVVTDFGGTESASGLAVQADGKVVVGGTVARPDGSQDFAAVRYDVSDAGPAPGSILTIADNCLGGTALLITGTAGDDAIEVKPGPTASTLKVTFNGVTSTVARPSGRIIVTGGAGDDDIQIAGGVTNQVWLYGDAGNDRLNAGNGGSLLIGGDGNDQLTGGNGRDVMIGGQGEDKLIGNSGDDILVSGFTIRDDRTTAGHEEFWCDILTEWSSTNSFAARVQNLRDGSGGNAHNGASLLIPAVRDDNSADQVDLLDGGAGNDWLIFMASEDRVVGQVEATN